MSIGSETLGGVRNVVVSNCTFNGTTSGIRIKSARGKGGVVENLVYTDITMTNVDFPINLTGYYPKVPSADLPQPLATNTPVYRNITVRNLVARSSRTAGYVVGLPEAPIEHLMFENVRVIAPTGLVVRNARDVEMRNARFEVSSGPPVILQTNAVVRGLPARSN
jgi:polygalacturonase